MEKIYGYKEKDVIGLAEFIKGKGNRPLSQIFESYALKNNKAKGTVRNLYYAMAKLSYKDQSFCDKYLNGKPIAVEKIVEFGLADENELVKKVLIGKNEGRSVRSVIMEMAGGDGKVALRYQNKYRNAVKFKPQLVSKIITEINGSHELLLNKNNNNEKSYAVEKLINKFRDEFSSILNKTVFDIKKENQELKEKINYLERENEQLTEKLNINTNSKVAINFFGQKGGQSLPS